MLEFSQNRAEFGHKHSGPNMDIVDLSQIEGIEIRSQNTVSFFDSAGRFGPRKTRFFGRDFQNFRDPRLWRTVTLAAGSPKAPDLVGRDGNRLENNLGDALAKVTGGCFWTRRYVQRQF